MTVAGETSGKRYTRISELHTHGPCIRLRIADPHVISSFPCCSLVWHPYMACCGNTCALARSQKNIPSHSTLIYRDVTASTQSKMVHVIPQKKFKFVSTSSFSVLYTPTQTISTKAYLLLMYSSWWYTFVQNSKLTKHSTNHSAT